MTQKKYPDGRNKIYLNLITGELFRAHNRKEAYLYFHTDGTLAGKELRKSEVIRTKGWRYRRLRRKWSKEYCHQ